MSRYRPPRPRSSPYITAAGHRALTEELRDIWVTRRDVVKHLAAAAAEGDRSENAEYIYRKKQLREIDRRLRYLQKRVPDLEVVSSPPPDPARVFFGARVSVCNEDGETMELRIVGADEIDPSANHISVDAPMARALLGRGVDDEVVVTTPGGDVTWYVEAVRYDS